MKTRPELDLVDAPVPSKKELDAASAAIRALVGGSIDRFDNEALLALALGDDVADEASLDEERVDANLLRHALDGQGEHPLAELASALRVATGSKEVDELTHERLVRRALHERENRAAPRRYWPIASAIVALAAGIALLIGNVTADRSEREVAASLPRLRAAAATVALIPSRSTESLFDASTAFGARGGESARVGRIVASRASDFRANRFARWGVR